MISKIKHQHSENSISNFFTGTHLILRWQLFEHPEENSLKVSDIHFTLQLLTKAEIDELTRAARELKAVMKLQPENKFVNNLSKIKAGKPENAVAGLQAN